MRDIYKIVDVEFGDIPVVYSTRAKRVLLKSRFDGLLLVIPRGMCVEEVRLTRFIDANRPAIRKMLLRTARNYENTGLYPGKVIKIEECEIHIVTDNTLAINRVKLELKERDLWVYINGSNNLEDSTFVRHVSQCVVRRIGALYGSSLVGMTFDYARRYGLGCPQVRIGRGRQVLGHCSSEGVITLSAYLLFYPLHLRRYIVCHELAHIKHRNHGSEFHKLCNHYCEGHENEWQREIRKFRLQVL